MATLVSLVVFAFLPSLWGEFVSDDRFLILDNPLHDSVEGLWKIWTSAEPLDPWPLTNSAFWILKSSFGENAFAFHGCNILLHALNACLLFLVLQRLSVPGAWLAAAIWAVHPMQAETVAWASELKNLLCLAFALLSVLLYWRFLEKGGRGLYAGSLLAFLLSLLAKSASAPLPAVLLLLIWWRRGTLSRNDIVRVVPFLVLAGLAGVIGIWFQAHRASADWTSLDWTLAQRLEHALAALGSYMQGLFFPWTCRFDVPRPSSWFDGRILAGGLLVLMAALFWVKRATWGRGAFVALAAYGLFLSTLLGFFDHYMLQFSPAADRWQYLASAVAIAFLVAAANAWSCRIPRTACLGISGLLLLGLTTLSFERSKVFQAEETLWEDSLSRNPRSALSRAGLGRVAALRFDFSRAESLLREAIALDPRFLLAHDYLGSVLRAKGDRVGAEKVWRDAMALEPRFAQARESLGFFLMEQGRRDEGRALLEEALAIDPYLSRARQALSASSR